MAAEENDECGNEEEEKEDNVLNFPCYVVLL
jgi:hypothetical protein